MIVFINFIINRNISLPERTNFIFYKGIYFEYKQSIHLSAESSKIAFLNKVYRELPKYPFMYIDSITLFSFKPIELVWELLMEFMRAYGFKKNFKLYLAADFESSIALPKVNINRFIPTVINSAQKKFDEIVKIDTKEKSDLLRLFSMAEASFDFYFKIMFYIHIIVNKEEIDKGLEYINTVIKETDFKTIFHNEIKELKIKSSFGKIDDVNDLVVYIKELRNAIAHFIRNDPDKPHMRLDGYREDKHLRAATRILSLVAKRKLVKLFDFNLNADLNICHLCDEKEVWWKSKEFADFYNKVQNEEIRRVHHPIIKGQIYEGSKS